MDERKWMVQADDYEVDEDVFSWIWERKGPRFLHCNWEVMMRRSVEYFLQNARRRHDETITED